MAELKSNLIDSDSESEPEYIQYKVIVVGNGAVGKTSLATRFCEEHFGKAYKQTIGLDFMVKRLVLPGKVAYVYIWRVSYISILICRVTSIYAFPICLEYTLFFSIIVLYRTLAVGQKTLPR